MMFVPLASAGDVTSVGEMKMLAPGSHTNPSAFTEHSQYPSRPGGA